jgi:ATP diphosphatase
MNDAAHPLDKLKEVMARLRDPNGGCPWDLEQDFKSIAPYTIEEAYEVADAIENDDMENLREELGDLLFQSVYHAQMASEQGLFTLDDVVNDVTAKMISRHPHVFGDIDANTADDVDGIWEALKAKEKGAIKHGSALDGVPKAFPALLRAQKLQKKAAKTGFEWTHITDVLDKLEEELAEMREAVAQGTIEQKGEELGDILFVLANYARLLGLNSEEALRNTNNKFERRFRGMEQDLKKEDKVMSALTLDQMTQLWIKQ